MKEIDSTDSRGSIGTGTSRRRFLGGSMAAAVASLSASPLTAAKVAAQAASMASGVEALKPTGPVDEAYWQKIRKEFNIVDDITYMNNGGLGPMPRTVFDAHVRYLREIAEDPRRGRSPNDLRSKVAAFVGADPDEICLTRSTTEGIKILCAGLDLNEGDEVLMSSHEHWGGYGPWRAREKREGIKVSTVVIPAPPESADQVIDMVERALTPKTRVLVVSHPI